MRYEFWLPMERLSNPEEFAHLRQLKEEAVVTLKDLNKLGKSGAIFMEAAKDIISRKLNEGRKRFGFSGKAEKIKIDVNLPVKWGLCEDGQLLVWVSVGPVQLDLQKATADCYD